MSSWIENLSKPLRWLNVSWNTLQGVAKSQYVTSALKWMRGLKLCAPDMYWLCWRKNMKCIFWFSIISDNAGTVSNHPFILHMQCYGCWWSGDTCKGTFLLSFEILSGLDTLLGINSLGPSDAMCRQKTGSTLAQVMACCLTTPSHCLNQCWHITNKLQWHSSQGKFRYLSQPSITEII